MVGFPLVIADLIQEILYYLNRVFLKLLHLQGLNNKILSNDLRCWPCGVCLLFEELFGSESISQVYAIILEFLATLDKADRDKIEYILYGEYILLIILFFEYNLELYRRHVSPRPVREKCVKEEQD